MRAARANTRGLAAVPSIDTHEDFSEAECELRSRLHKRSSLSSIDGNRCAALGLQSLCGHSRLKRLLLIRPTTGQPAVKGCAVTPLEQSVALDSEGTRSEGGPLSLQARAAGPEAISSPGGQPLQRALR